MSRPAITLETLQRLADKLPKTAREMNGRSYRVPFYAASMPPLSPNDYHDYGPVDVTTITFHAEYTTIRDCNAIAWFYHDVLVKVVV